MKIKITKKVPVDSRHGIEVGNVYEVVPGPSGKPGVWIQSKISGERVRLMNVEWERYEKAAKLTQYEKTHREAP